MGGEGGRDGTPTQPPSLGWVVKTPVLGCPVTAELGVSGILATSDSKALNNLTWKKS